MSCFRPELHRRQRCNWVGDEVDNQPGWSSRWCGCGGYAAAGAPRQQREGDPLSRGGLDVSGPSAAPGGVGAATRPHACVHALAGCCVSQVWCEVCGTTDDDGERMVACDQCGIWKHTRCCGISDDEDIPDTFVCAKCAHGTKGARKAGGAGCTPVAAASDIDARRVASKERRQLLVAALSNDLLASAPSGGGSDSDAKPSARKRRPAFTPTLPGCGWGADGPAGRRGWVALYAAVARRVALLATVARRVERCEPRTAGRGPSTVRRPV
eukprot:364926-Chlamydomonas_euryale.AAC.5